MTAPQNALVCGQESMFLFGPKIVAELGLQYPDLHFSAQSMATVAISLARVAGHNLCMLPYCTTVEAEALGAQINMGDSTTGPRAGAYRFESLVQVKEHLGDIDFSKGRIAEVLEACRQIKKQNYLAVVEVSGPLNILNYLIDFSIVIKTWKKNEALLMDVFQQIGSILEAYIIQLKLAGANVISFADPMAAKNIIGQSYAASFNQSFLMPFMHSIRPHLHSMLMHLCPKLAHLLVELKSARWQLLQVPESLSYGQVLAQSIGKEKFMGYLCINKASHCLTDGVAYALHFE